MEQMLTSNVDTFSHVYFTSVGSQILTLVVLHEKLYHPEVSRFFAFGLIKKSPLFN